MNLFFSPPVRTYSALIPHYQACSKVDILISTGYIQFQLTPYDDSTDPYYLIYSRIRSLKHRLINLIQDIENKYNQELPKLTKDQKLITIAKMKQYMKDHHIDHLKYLDYQQSQIQKKLYRFGSLSGNYDSITNMSKKIDEELDVLLAKLDVSNHQYVSQQFSMIHGICKNKDKAMLQRILFRKSRGYSYVIFKNRSQIHSHTDTSIFICLMNKNVYKHIGDKLLAICNINQVVLYQLPNLSSHLLTYQKTLLQRKEEIQKVLDLSGHQLTRVLKESITSQGDSLRHHLAKISYLQRIVYIICHSKQIGQPANHVLLTMHIPLTQPIPHLGLSIIPAAKKKPRTIIPSLPCLYQTNILTQLFSIPKHNELLPAVFMFTTVPFLFGMMFSDIGHGIMLMIICTYLQVGPIFYLMAFMSIYCGFIYNQFFGMKIIRWNQIGIIQAKWGISQNGLNFENSLKMKISMIIAFIHMFFGTFLKMVNQYKRKQYKNIFYDSIPKLGLLVTTVGYLIFFIIYKWLTNYHGREKYAPSIINSMLELYLGWNPNRKQSILGSMENQKYVGSIMIMFDFLFIGIMLYNHTIRHRLENLWQRFSRYRLRKSYKNINETGSRLSQQDDYIDQQISQQLQQTSMQLPISLQQQYQHYYIEPQTDHESELGPLQIFEYILSLISSTTSYLRLFALSLAHGKLSHLLLGFLLGSLTDYHPSISILRCFVFFISTCTLMLALDVMECIMHVVRLHWVQWMGKFYTGKGTVFHPQVQENYQ